MTITPVKSTVKHSVLVEGHKVDDGIYVGQKISDTEIERQHRRQHSFFLHFVEPVPGRTSKVAERFDLDVTALVSTGAITVSQVSGSSVNTRHRGLSLEALDGLTAPSLMFFAGAPDIDLETETLRKYIIGRCSIPTPPLLITNGFSEVEMNSKVFDRPVYLRERRELIREITCLEDAIEFLEEWPERDRDIVHDAALKTCYMAFDGHKPVKTGRNAIRSFGEKKGILVKSTGVMPWMIRSRSGGGRLSA